MKKRKNVQNGQKVMAIDPGKKGAIVVLGTGHKLLLKEAMPLDSAGDVDFDKVCEIIYDWPHVPIYLERAVSFGMGMKMAFNYGRDFRALEIATRLYRQNSVLYIEPNKWTKEMHAGIDKDLKAKVKSLVAFARLFPHLEKEVPRDKKQNLHDGIVDAILIAAFGLKNEASKTGLQGLAPSHIIEDEMKDFY